MSFIGVFRKPGTGVVKVSNPCEAENIRLVSETLSAKRRLEYLRMKMYEQVILQAHGRDTSEAIHELIREYFA